MKTNRREFLKGGLAGLFGAFLTRAGVARAEEAVHIIEPWEVPCGDYPGCDGCPARSQCLANEDRKAFDYTEVADYDWPEYADGPRGYARNFQHNPDSDLGRLFSQTGQIDWPRTNALLEEIGILPREPAHISNLLSWNDSADTGGALMTVPASLTDCTSSESWEGGFKRSAIDGHLVCWDSIEGSDEDGTGTWDDPVATEACARSIADNPPFRV